MVGWHILENIYRAAWPINLQLVNSSGGAQSKMEPQIILREIAAAASHLIDLRVVSGCASHPGADATTVGFHSYEPEFDPVIPIYAVRTQKSGIAVHVIDDQVYIPVIIEVAKSYAAT
jgi:hypothetical protein